MDETKKQKATDCMNYECQYVNVFCMPLIDRLKLLA